MEDFLNLEHTLLTIQASQVGTQMVNNVRSMLKISYAGCPGLSSAISAQFTLEMCTAAENCKKNTKTPYFGNSWSFKIIHVDTIKKLVTSSCYDKQYLSLIHI